MKLELCHPLKRLIITQNWTENNACIRNDGIGGVIPRTGPNCPVGYQSIYKSMGLFGHNGLDLGAKDWEPVYASLEGVVTELQTERERGLGIEIVSQQKYEWNDSFSYAEGENHIKHRYWHLAGFNVKLGEVIKVGDVIGWADNTGYSTGTHLHFEIKPVENGMNILQNNRMYGCIDPMPYMGNLSAVEKEDTMAKIYWMLADISAQVQDFFLKAAKK